MTLLVVKVGSQAILEKNGTLDLETMRVLVEQITTLHRNNTRVVLVTSGAIASGRRIAQTTLGRAYGASMVEKQLLASLGQPELMHAYASLFKEHGFLASQLLLTKQDFHTRKHYLNIAHLLREILTQKAIIPVINENDSVAVEELMFTDNDELAGLIAAQLGADRLVILSSIQGVYDRHPDAHEARVIPVIHPDDRAQVIASVKTSQGRGGMISKMVTARTMADLGIVTHIAHVHETDVMLRLTRGEQVGTTLLARPKKSALKRWLAFHNPPPVGHICMKPWTQKVILSLRGK